MTVLCSPRVRSVGAIMKEDRLVNRRSLLQGFGSTAASAAALAALDVQSAQAYNPGPEESRARYRETDHVRAFYRTNGYETLQK